MIIIVKSMKSKPINQIQDTMLPKSHFYLSQTQIFSYFEHNSSSLHLFQCLLHSTDIVLNVAQKNPRYKIAQSSQYFKLIHRVNRNHSQNTAILSNLNCKYLFETGDSRLNRRNSVQMRKISIFYIYVFFLDSFSYEKYFHIYCYCHPVWDFATHFVYMLFTASMYSNSTILLKIDNF